MSAALIRLRQAAAERRRAATLAPDGVEATGLARLIRLADEDPPEVADAFADLLVDTTAALENHFPHNLMGDLDYLAASTLASARRARDPVAHLMEARDRLVALHELFGRSGPIRFRYIHDFIYGFDWARWVARDPERRAGVGPFDLEFLAYMEARGHELLDLIAAGNDEKYPPLDGPGHRNPFRFQRDPVSEERLLRRLARQHALPVEAWRTDARPDWNRDYTALREAAAAELEQGTGS